MNNQKQEWVDASIKLGKELQYFMVDVQQLGDAEQVLLGMEERARAQHIRKSSRSAQATIWANSVLEMASNFDGKTWSLFVKDILLLLCL